MKTARDLLSHRVVPVEPEQRLRDVAALIQSRNALYCAVVGRAGEFIGLVRLTEIVMKSADRIFADLISASAPVHISDTLDAELVIKLLQAQGCDELAVLEGGRRYVGLVTRESVFEWWAGQRGPE
ncbi:MAG TPA: CBS domain-containing protein [Opitutaceae bacterium]|nr:CBS domain-containing protein [Opitutaceae bacterium]